MGLTLYRTITLMPEAKIQSSNYLTDTLGPDRLRTSPASGVLMVSFINECTKTARQPCDMAHTVWAIPYSDLVSGRPLTPGAQGLGSGTNLIPLSYH